MKKLGLFMAGVLSLFILQGCSNCCRENSCCNEGYTYGEGYHEDGFYGHDGYRSEGPHYNNGTYYGIDDTSPSTTPYYEGSQSSYLSGGHYNSASDQRIAAYSQPVNQVQSNLQNPNTTIQSNSQNPNTSDINASSNDISRRIRTALQSDNTLSDAAKNIQISVDGGTVTLTGSVASTTEKSRIESTIKRINGVRNVTNNLDVGSKY